METKTVEEMEALVSDYIFDKKGVRVNIDIQTLAKMMPRGLSINYLKDQVVKLNIAYNDAVEYYRNKP